MEFYASYVYLSMSSYFNRDDQALHGFAAHFKTESGEERAHGMKLMEYQTKRGGRVVFQGVAKPTTMEWGTPLEAMEAALELGKDGQPEPSRLAQGGRRQGRRTPLRLPRVRVPGRAGGGHQGHRGPDHQDEES